ILPTLGKRGVWLAQFNNRWAFALGISFDYQNDEAFRLGAPKERTEFIQKMRAVEAQKALLLLESVWENEDYQSRADFLKTLLVGLSDADLPFIEAALEDKRKEVRSEAATLLAL